MIIVCSPSSIVSIAHPTQGIADTIKGGFQNLLLDISKFCAPGELEATGLLEKAGNHSFRPSISETCLSTKNPACAPQPPMLLIFKETQNART